MITEPRAAAGAHPSEELRVQSQLHREPKGEIVHCETGEAFSTTALLAAFSTASARFSSFLMRSSCAGRAAFCDCSDRTAGPRKASAAASTSVRRRMVFTGPGSALHNKLFSNLYQRREGSATAQRLEYWRCRNVVKRPTRRFASLQAWAAPLGYELSSFRAPARPCQTVW